MGFKDEFLNSTKKAKEYMNKMQNGDYNCVEDFTCLLRGYILKKFLLDAPVNVIYTDNGEFKLSKNQLNDILNGKYDFLIE